LGISITSAELERLVAIHKLKREPPSKREIEGLIRSAIARLEDASVVLEAVRALPHSGEARNGGP
jgi:hypothetical protein